MGHKFIVKHKNAERKEDKSVVMTLRLNKELQEMSYVCGIFFAGKGIACQSLALMIKLRRVGFRNGYDERIVQ